jgi:hypothetical protein
VQVPANIAFLDGVQNQILDAFRLSDPAVSVALGARCVRKSRQGRQRYETGICPSVQGWLIGTKTPAGSLRYVLVGARLQPLVRELSSFAKGN